MFCEKCGKQIPDDAAFCEFCGQKVAEKAAAPTAQPQAAVPAQQPQTMPVQQPQSVPAAVAPAPVAAAAAPAASGTSAKDFLAKNKLWLIIAACVLVVVIAVIAVVVTLGKRVDMSKYIKVEVTGYNGYGELEYDFDSDSFVKRVKGDKSAKSYSEDDENDDITSSLNKLNSALSDAADYALIVDALEIETELPEGKDDEHLSNDDVVKFTFTFDAAVAKKYGITAKTVTYEYTVSDLTEAKTFDVMQYFDLTFSGIDGEGRASIKSTAAEVKVGDATFTIEEDSSYVSCTFKNGRSGSFNIRMTDYAGGLSVGDTVKLQAGAEEDEFAAQGVILTNLTKEIKVEKLGKYVTKLSDVSEVLSAITEKGKETVSNYLYSDWSGAVHNSWWGSFENQSVGEDMALYKTIMTTPKDTTDSTHSRLWCVYSVTLNDSQMEAPTVYYFAVSYRNLTLDPNGELDNADDLRYDKRTRGYTSFDELFNEQITAYNLNVEQSEN